MTMFDVDSDLAALVERLARRQPFEVLTFSEALRRVLAGLDESTSHAGANETAAPTTAPKRHRKGSPDPISWLSAVPDHSLDPTTLKGLLSDPNLKWEDICRSLRIETNGASARLVLANWVSVNQPEWPPVPEPK